MTQLAIASQSMPVLNPAHAAAAGEAAAATSDGQAAPDFAVVLQAQIAQPAKDTAEAAILAAALPLGAAEEDSGAAGPDPLAAATDLMAGLLPDMAVLAQAPAAAVAPAVPQPGDATATQPPLAAAAGLGISPPPARNAAAALTDSPAAATSATASPPGQAGTAATSGQPATAASSPPQAATAATPAATTPAEAKSTAAAVDAATAPAQAQAAAPHVPAGPAGDAPGLSRIDTPVGARGWDAEVGQKVVWMVNRMESRAELSLTPPQLGKVDVSITVSGEQTSATFVAASPAAREALEQALPRLREILAEAGISLGQASVNAESPRDERKESAALTAAGRGEAQAERAEATVTQWARTGNGLIDTFA